MTSTHPHTTAVVRGFQAQPKVKMCECCNDSPATVKVNGWIDSWSGLRGQLVAMLGRNTYYAFRGDLCADCNHDHMLHGEEGDDG